jgi:hypothetical protein
MAGEANGPLELEEAKEQLRWAASSNPLSWCRQNPVEATWLAFLFGFFCGAFPETAHELSRLLCVLPRSKRRSLRSRRSLRR